MSKSIDDRVVEMRFDNKNFENNVRTSMSTIEKLKEKLNFKGATKGFENVKTAANNVNMSGLSGAVDSVRVRFSALEIMGVTALVNITNAAVNAGKRILKSLTIEPITTGFNEYELKMDSVRTIMASTGESVSVVNKYLEELNEYSDQTIYSFSDMTQNIGKFTNAGVKLEDAVMAIKGISNEAAVSGANANEASRAMYNFAQALSAGHVKLIDWKSIELANMATKEFKEQLLQSAVAAGTLTKTADGMYRTLEGDVLSSTKNFNETLEQQWMTTDVLVNTLKDYADSTTEIGAKAFAAAQDVTKFTQMMDVLKETAQSGWARTWEIIFGDINQAKAIFTPLTDFFSKLISKMSDFRNNLLEGALSSPLGEMAKKISSVTSVATTAVEKMKDYGEMVNKVLHGDLGNGQKRWDKLTEAGYDWMHVQNLVNEKLGDSTRYATNYSETTGELVKKTAELTDAKLKEIGLTDEEIKAYRNLEVQARRTGVPIEELISNMDGVSGRTLLIDTLKNAGSGLLGVFTALKDAWVDAFPPMTSTQLYNIIAGVHRLSESLRLTDKTTGALNETGDKIRRTLKGVFAIIDIFTTITGGALRIGLKLLGAAIGNVDLNILDLTAAIGDAISSFRDFLFENNLIIKGLAKIVPLVKIGAEKIREFINAFMDLPIVRENIEKIKKSFDGMANIGGNLIDGLINGLKDGSFSIVDIMMDLGRKILVAIKDVLGIHSPSTEMYDIGSNSVLGFVNGIQNGFGLVTSKLKELGEKAINTVKGIDFGPLLSIGAATGTIFILKKIGDALDTLSSPIDGISDIFTGFGKVLFSTSKVLKSFSTKVKSQALLNVAIALGILVASIALLTYLDTGKVWGAIGALGALAVIIGVLSAAVGKFGPDKAISFGAFSLAVLAISASLLIMAFALNKISSIDQSKLIDSSMALVAMIGGLSLVLAAYGKFVTGEASKNINKAGGMLVKLSLVLLLMVFTIKQISKLEPKDLAKGITVITIFGAFLTGLMTATKLIGPNATGIGTTLLKISLAMLLLVFVIKQASKLKKEDIEKGAAVVAALGVFIAGLMFATNLAGPNASKIGISLLMISGAMSILVGVIKQISKLEGGDISKGLAVVAALGAILSALIVVTKSAGHNVAKAGVSMLLMSISIGILVGVMALIALLSPEDVAKGVLAISALGAVFALILQSTRGVQDIKGNLIVMTIAIAVMAASIAALSLIDGSKLAGASLALGTLMGMFALMAKASGYSQKAMGSLIIMTLTIGILSGVIYLLSKLPIESALASSAALSMLLLSLSGSMLIISKVNSVSASALVALGIMSLAIGILGGTLYLLSGLPIDSLIGSAVGLSILMISLSASMLIMSKMGPSVISGAAALTLLAVSIAILTPSLISLGSMSLGNIGVSLLALAGAFTVIGVAGILLGPLAPIIFTLSASITLLGVGCLAAGMGIQAFSSGLASLAVSGPAGANALVVAVTSILGLIPVFIAQIGLGIIEFANVIANGIPAITSAITAVLVSILASIGATAPALISTLGILLSSLLNFIVTYIPKMVDTGMKLLYGILNGIADNIQGIVETAIKIVTEFINGVASQIPNVIQAGFNLILSFINGLADAIRGNTGKMISAIKNLFSAIVEAGFKILTSSVSGVKTIGSKIMNSGLVTGIKSGVSGFTSTIRDLPLKAISTIREYIGNFQGIGGDIVGGIVKGIANNVSSAITSAKNLANSILKGAKKALGINSPSREFMGVAKYSVMGLTNGLVKFAKNSVSAAKNLGKNTVKSLSNSMSGIPDIINGDMDTQPTIRPVLDLSDVKSGASSIDGILYGKSLSVSAESAGIISDSMLSIQNGRDNSDIVTAIKDLRKDLSNISSDTYNVNGVTYDDGSNIVDAVKTLVRAAKVERRV